MTSDQRMMLQRCLGLFGLVVLVIIGLQGCKKGNPDDRDIIFSHETHVEELECSDCHNVLDGGRIGFPEESTCVKCHNEMDDDIVGRDGKPTENCLTCHNLGDASDWKGKKVVMGSSKKRNLKFDHELHKDADISCETCHDGIGKNDKLEMAGQFRPDQSLCAQCHQEEGIDNSCSTCHTTNDQGRILPSDHVGQFWMERHGSASEFETGGHGRSCSDCHEKNECTECHETQAPRSHNAHWDRHSHGLEASMDRDKCATCHKQSMCDECHNDTTPLNHVGNWVQRHCQSCHFESFTPEGNGCTVCHKINVHP